MSFTTKKIAGIEYDYFEFYINGKKKTVLLGKTGETHNQDNRNLVLKVLMDRLFVFASKLWRYIEKFNVSYLCKNPYHATKAEIKDSFERLLKAFDERVKKREPLPLITVVYEDRLGNKQITDLCVDCLYRKLDFYGSFGYKRKPKRLGILFLNKEVDITV